MFSNSIFAFAAFAASVAAVPTLKRQAPAGVPDYVTRYAPLVWLYSGEKYFPSDISAQLAHTTPEVNFLAVSGAPNPLSLDDLNLLSSDTYLTSNDDITKGPAWLSGVKPDGNGKTQNAVSAAIIVNDKGNGNVDAFYMYFYAYNWGGTVAGINELQFGNHVGDWEHNMVRFSNGVPQAVWYSQHGNGEAFTYQVLNKKGDRPITYSGNGTHANYAIKGNHDHTIPNLNLPFGFLEDHTDEGTLWDPLQSAYFYKFNAADNSFTAYDGSSPTNWLQWLGHWGDQQYPNGYRGQIVLFNQPKYASGPTGPLDKQLNRNNVCPDNGNDCILRSVLVPRSLEEEQ